MFRSSISIFGIRTPRPEHDVESAAPAETAPPVRTFSTFPVESAPPVPTFNVENTPQQSQSRFGRFSINARTIVGSSVYSQSPGQPRWKTPKMPAMPWGRRPVSADLDTVVSASNGSTAFASHTAASYVGAISQEQLRTPAQPTQTYNRHPADVPLPTLQDPFRTPEQTYTRTPELTYARHPADVPLPTPQNAQDPFVDPEVQEIADEINRGPRRHKRRKRRNQHRADHWKRKRSERGRMMPFVRGTAARGKLTACIISGFFLLTVLTVCTYPIPLLTLFDHY